MTQTTPAYIIIGASGGIGSALCHTLSQRGGRLAVAARDEARLHALASQTNASLAQALDARDGAQLQAFFKQAKERLGQIDGVINCAGSLLLKPAHRTTDQEWDDVINTNLRTAFNTVRASANVMRGKGGSVVLMSSAAARHGFASHEAIAAAKAGVIGLTLSAAASYASWKIRVNAIAPGLVQTPLAQPITSNPAATKASQDMHALGRLGQPEDVASLAAWLLEPSHSWITGQVFGVDGGLSTVRSRRG